MELQVDSRLLASFDVKAKQWRVSARRYAMMLAEYAGATGESAEVRLGRAAVWAVTEVAA